MFHRHKWRIVEQAEQPSAWEQMTESGHPPTKMAFESQFFVFKRDVIVKRVCETCGTEEVRRL